jgi:hypothetical protein
MVVKMVDTTEVSSAQEHGVVTVVSYVNVVTGTEGGIPGAAGGVTSGAAVVTIAPELGAVAGGAPGADGVGWLGGVVGLRGMYVGQSVMRPGFSGTCAAQIPSRY